MKTRVLGLGHSHLSCLKRASGLPDTPWDSDRSTLELVHLGGDAFAPDVTSLAAADMLADTGTDTPEQQRNARFARRARAAAGYAAFQGKERHRVLTPEFEGKVSALLDEKRPDVIVAIPKGNEYGAVSLINFPQPFMLGGDAANAVSEQVMRAQMRFLAESGALLFWRLLNDISKVPVLFVPPPPPIRSEAHLRANPGNFAAAIKASGVPDAALRLRMYRIYVDVLREEVTGAGGLFFDLPDAASDDGFLPERFCRPDPIHANVDYGVMLLRHLQPALNALLEEA